ncbi:MAG: sensor histidine kinase [Terriglobales bacterium]
MSRTFKERTYWTCQVVGWVLYVLLGLTFIIEFPPGPPLWRFALVYLTGAAIGILVSHGFRLFLRSRDWARVPALGLTWRVSVASVGMGVLIVIPMIGVYTLAFSHAFIHSDGLRWVWPALWAWAWACFVWNLIYLGVHYLAQYRRSEFEKLQLQMAARDAELRALLAQLNPHFLFNSLNSLRALISLDPGRAQALLTDLSQLLRYTLTAGGRETVTLAEELEAVGAYLQLESARLDERLRIQLEADPDALRQPLPPMLLQTLVENAIKHGIAQRLEGGTLRIAAQVRGGQLQLEVENPGQLTASPNSTRVGLENARERLRLLYGAAARLEVRNQDADSVLAQVTLPAAARAGA